MSTQYQLFVGRLPRGCRNRDLEDIFYKYGKMTRCDVKTAYGFVEYEDRRDAEDAIHNEHGRDFMGARIVVEWARGPKYDHFSDSYRGGRDRDRDRDRHRDDRRRSRSRDRYDRKRSRSRSRDRDRRRSRDRDHDKRRSRSRSHDRDDERRRSRSRS